MDESTESGHGYYILASQMAKTSQIPEIRVKLVDVEWAKVLCPAQLSIYIQESNSVLF